MPPEACTVERVALTYEQIKQRGLPERPPKKSDARTPWFEEMFDCGCVELDALPPADLIAIVRQAVREAIADPDAWDASGEREAEERERLRAFVEENQAYLDGEGEPPVVLCQQCGILHHGMRCPHCG
jgi:rubrerythrin